MSATAETTTGTTFQGPPHLDAARRHDAVLLFDVADGNPNGDPDAGNLPRVDPETMQGLVTDVCIKRKIRNWVDATRGADERYKIYVQGDVALNAMHQRAYSALGLKSTGTKQNRGDVDRVQQWMCDNFFDIRTFGAVMSTGVNAGQVRGPAQLTFGRSIDPIVPIDLTITRIAITKPEEMQVVGADGAEGEGKRTEMGRKPFVAYGLYRTHVFFNPALAGRTGCDGNDLAILWEALERMWDLDRSASRGMMACRGLYVFSHDSPLGNAPAHALFDRIDVRRKDDVAAPRRFDQYDVAVDGRDLPAGVTLTRVVG